jgi:hypothetical protein
MFTVLLKSRFCTVRLRNFYYVYSSVKYVEISRVQVELEIRADLVQLDSENCSSVYKIAKYVKAYQGEICRSCMT